MSQRSHNRDTTLLTIELLRLIPRHGKTTAAELQQRLADIGFERDVRTIQRHLETLSTHFDDLECDMGSKPYGYRWKSHSHGLNLPILNEQESLLLMLAKEHLARLLPVQLLSFMQPFFEQAHRKLVLDAAGKPERAWLEKIGVAPTSQPLLPPKLADGVLEAVSSALFHDRKLDLVYRNQDGFMKDYRVWPMALVQQGSVLYLVVYFEGHTDLRHLALHRILEAEASQFRFERPQGFDLKRYIEQASFGFGSGHSIRLRFSIRRGAGLHLTETPLSADQQILEESKQHYRFQATVIDSEMLVWWLRKFGDDVWDIEQEVIEPQ